MESFGSTMDGVAYTGDYSLVAHLHDLRKSVMLEAVSILPTWITVGLDLGAGDHPQL